MQTRPSFADAPQALLTLFAAMAREQWLDTLFLTLNRYSFCSQHVGCVY